MNQKYFKYLLKSFWPTVTVYISLFLLFLVLIPFMIDCFCMMLIRMTFGYMFYLVAMGPACMFLSGLLPLLIHGRYYSKNKSDVLLSMPMNRKQAFLTEGIFGLALITSLSVVGYCFGCLICFILGNGTALLTEYGSSMAGLPLLFFACVATFLASNFAVSVANSKFQAIVMVGLVNLLPYLLYSLFVSPYGYSYIFSYNDYPNLMASVDTFTHGAGHFLGIYGTTDYGYNENYILTCLIALLCQILFWALLNVLAFFEFKKLKSEHLGTVIPQRFGVVNSTTLMYGLGFALMGEFFMAEVVHSGGWLGYIMFVYVFALFLISFFFWISIFIIRKKARFRKDDWMRYAIAIVGGLVLGVVTYSVLRFSWGLSI